MEIRFESVLARNMFSQNGKPNSDCFKNTMHWLLVTSLAMLVSCSPGTETQLMEPQIDCSAVELPSYNEVTIWPSCTNCHSSHLTGANRQGAPDDVNLDTEEGATEWAYLSAMTVYSATMPFTGTVTEGQKNSLYAWAICVTE